MKSEPLDTSEDNECELMKSENIEKFEDDETLVKSENLQDDPRGSAINTHDTEKKVLLTNLILKCRTEMENKCLLSPLQNFIQRVANYTGLSKAYIHQFISEEMKDIDLDNRYFQLDVRIQILKWVSSMYDEKQIPTSQNVFRLLKQSFVHLNFYQFRYMMSFLGFETQLTDTEQEILVEDPEFTFERFQYFRKLNDFKLNNVPIYYIDEVFVDKTFTFPKPWIKNIDVSCNDCDGYVFFHAVSKHSFLHGLFCSPTTPTDFTKWVAHFIIPQLKDQCVVVLDQNHLHRSNKNAITKYHSKKDMANYLRLNNIPCDDNLHKADLYKLIKDYTQKTSTFDIEELLKAHGHQVLWLPATFHDLSITHFLWQHIISTELCQLTKTPLQEIKNVLLQTLMNLQPHLWHRLSESLKKSEQNLFNELQKASKAFE